MSLLQKLSFKSKKRSGATYFERNTDVSVHVKSIPRSAGYENGVCIVKWRN